MNALANVLFTLVICKWKVNLATSINAWWRKAARLVIIHVVLHHLNYSDILLEYGKYVEINPNNASI